MSGILGILKDFTQIFTKNEQKKNSATMNREQLRVHKFKCNNTEFCSEIFISIIYH